MDLQSLTFIQLRWLNRQLGNHCRFWRRVQHRMDGQQWDRHDVTYRAIQDVVQRLSAACAETHRALSTHRDPMHDYSKKRSSQQLYRNRRRDEQERGE